MANDKVLLYGDRWSSTALWAKALFLLPVWFYLLLPVIGWVFLRFGNLGMQVGYPIVLLLGLTYFVDDVLRRKVRITDNHILLGFKKYKLTELSSVGLIYSANGITPVSLLLYFGNGKKLALHLSRLTYPDFEKILNLIENRVPHCTIDPVIQTLCKSKRLARKAAYDEPDRTVIKYRSRRLLNEIARTFLDTAQSWSRLGPVLTLIVAAPMWLTVSKTVFSMPLESSAAAQSPLAIQEMLTNAIIGVESWIGGGISSTTSAVWTFLSNPFAALTFIVILVPILVQFVRLLSLPNRLVLDASGAHLNLKLGKITVPTKNVAWHEISKATLVKPKAVAGPDQWQIQLSNSSDMCKLILDLAALNPEDRVRFSKSLERWAPQCAVDTALMETLMPRQANSYTELWLQSLAAPPERASLEPLSAGRTLQDNKFEVLRRVGVGGQGAAYLCAQHTSGLHAVNEKVVLKETIIPVFVESEIRKHALERFEQEARILRDLDSEHIVKLRDYFVEDHRGYLVLEYVDGKSLRDLVEDRGQLPEEQVKELCAQMCEMLRYLHAVGVIHRDFTPDNLILQKDGKLKVIDFNVAQTNEDGSGLVVGKQAYMPAEQFRGKPTTQSDIYAMGATLFYLLTGQDPEPITQSRVLEVQPSVSVTMDSIIQTCTAADCNIRFKDVAAIEEALGIAAKHAPDSVQMRSIQILETDSDDSVVNRAVANNSADVDKSVSDDSNVIKFEKQTVKAPEKEVVRVDA